MRRLKFLVTTAVISFFAVSTHFEALKSASSVYQRERRLGRNRRDALKEAQDELSEWLFCP